MDAFVHQMSFLRMRRLLAVCWKTWFRGHTSVFNLAKMGGLVPGILPVKSLVHPIGADLSLTETVCF